MLFYVRASMKPIAELPAPSEAPHGAAAAGQLPASLAAAASERLLGAKRPAPIGPQLPPELAAKRRCTSGDGSDDKEEEDCGWGAGQIGPALPPGWSSSGEHGGNGGAAATPAAPGPFSRAAMGVPVAAAAVAKPQSAVARPCGTTRIGGPPLRHINIKLRPAGAKVAGSGQQAQQPRPAPPLPPQQQQQQREEEEELGEERPRELLSTQESPSGTPSTRNARPALRTARAQQHKQQEGDQGQQEGQHHQQAQPCRAAPSVPAPSTDPALAAIRAGARATLLDRLLGPGGGGVREQLQALARGRREMGLPLSRPSDMPAPERLAIQKAVGAGGAKAAYELLTSTLTGAAPELGEWRAAVEREARQEVAAGKRRVRCSDGSGSRRVARLSISGVEVLPFYT